MRSRTTQTGSDRGRLSSLCLFEIVQSVFYCKEWKCETEKNYIVEYFLSSIVKNMDALIEETNQQETQAEAEEVVKEDPEDLANLNQIQNR